MSKQAYTHFIVVDDDSINNHICRLGIKLLFPEADIQTFTDPYDALWFIQSNYKDAEIRNTILFLDINMPIMSGWEVLDVFLTYPDELKRQFTIYILSSSVAIEDKVKAEQIPIVSGFVEKPLTKAQLQQHLFMQNA